VQKKKEMVGRKIAGGGGEKTRENPIKKVGYHPSKTAGDKTISSTGNTQEKKGRGDDGDDSQGIFKKGKTIFNPTVIDTESHERPPFVLPPIGTGKERGGHEKRKLDKFYKRSKDHTQRGT